MQFNPSPTTNFAGTFGVISDGYIQGLFQDDPAIRYQLAGGLVGSGVTTPMWGGEAVTESLPAAVPQPLGNNLILATSVANLTGFTVFNQAGAGLVSAQSEVPLYSAGMSVHFFRMGTGARIAVACDPTFAAAALSGQINQQCLWDFTNQKLIAYTSGTALPVKILDIQIGNSKTVSYNAGTGFASWVLTGTCALIEI